MTALETVLSAPLLLPAPADALRDWLRLLGGLHPLIVHFPIALICLVPVMEVYARHHGGDGLRKPIGFILTLALISAVLAPIAGWLLAWVDGYSGRLVEMHMWIGFSVPALCAIAVFLQRSGARVLYGTTLALTVLSVVFAGFLGGGIAHGPNHLTAYLPASLRALTDSGVLEQPGADQSTYFGARVLPVLSARCTSCHGSEKSKGQLRLDSFAAIMRGGRGGAVVTPGDIATSELYRRIVLDPGHRDFMPGDGNPPLSPGEIAMIARWIEEGAELSTPDIAGEAEYAAAIPARREAVVMPVPDFKAIESDRKDLAARVSSIQLEYPHILAYTSRSSAELELNAAMWGEAFGDSDLAAFADVSGRIVRADFTGTSITDTSADLILSMHDLRTLRIGDTAISEQLVASLVSLPALESLYLSDSTVSASTRHVLSNWQGNVFYLR